MLSRPASALELSASSVPPAHRTRVRAGAPRVGVIWNPRSHRNLGGVPTGEGCEGATIATPTTKQALEQALRRFALSGIDVLVVKGGDGTMRDVLSYGATVFGGNWPRLVMVPRGKTNALAIDLELPRKWASEAVNEAIARGNTVTRRPLVIERGASAAGEDEHALWGFIFGAGAFNAAIQTGQVAHRFGAFQSAAIGITAAMGLAKAVFGIGGGPWRRTAPMRIERDGIELPHSGRGNAHDRYLALFSTLRRFPVGISPFRKSDGNIRFLLLDQPIRRVTARLPAILSAIERPFYPDLGIHRGAGTTFELELGQQYTLDGEMFEPGRLVMREGPPLEFIVP
jgi:diacylglycerol kinase (ATP)